MAGSTSKPHSFRFDFTVQMIHKVFAFVHVFLITFDRQNIIGFAFDNRLCNLFLRTNRIVMMFPLI